MSHVKPPDNPSNYGECMQFPGTLKGPGTIRKKGKTLPEEEAALYTQDDEIRFRDSKEPSRATTWNDTATDSTDTKSGIMEFVWCCSECVVDVSMGTSSKGPSPGPRRSFHA
jgi:hypothetical protein